MAMGRMLPGAGANVYEPFAPPPEPGPFSPLPHDPPRCIAERLLRWLQTLNLHFLSLVCVRMDVGLVGVPLPGEVCVQSE